MSVASQYYTPSSHATWSPFYYNGASASLPQSQVQVLQQPQQPQQSMMMPMVQMPMVQVQQQQQQQQQVAQQPPHVPQQVPPQQVQQVPQQPQLPQLPQVPQVPQQLQLPQQPLPQQMQQMPPQQMPPQQLPQMPMAPVTPTDVCYGYYYYAPRMAPSTLPLEGSTQEEYDEALMVEFLATSAYQIMSGGTAMWTQAQVVSFHRFVQGVLRSTRLSKHTILLSLCYLSHRWTLGNFPDSRECDYDMHYLLFVVSLVLANKIHDDNTFTNSSWCQATGIPAAQVTRAEGRWLSAIGWGFDIHNTAGWFAWNERLMGFMGSRSRVASPSTWPMEVAAF